MARKVRHNMIFKGLFGKKKINKLLFSSPEHNMLKGDIVWSSCVRSSFKHHLLLNGLTNLDQTCQECFLGGPFEKLSTEFDSIKNSGCHGNQMDFSKQFFKNLLLWNHWPDSEIISQQCSLDEPFQIVLAKF